MCPKGSDPLSVFTVFRTIVITTSFSANQDLSGDFRFTFENNAFLFPKDASTWSSSACILAFQAMSNIDKVLCTQALTNNGLTATYTVLLKSFPLFPYQNNIYYHEGDPPLSFFECTHFQNAAEYIASWTGTTLSVLNISYGVVKVGDRISGLGLTTGTTVSAVLTSKGTGTYTLSASTITSGTNQVVLLESRAYATASWSTSSTTLTVSAVQNGTLAVGQTVTGNGIAKGTIIWRIISGSGGVGTYRLSTLPLRAGSNNKISAYGFANITATWSANSATLTSTGIVKGLINVGLTVTASGIPSGTTIASIVSGGFGLGTYTISSAQVAAGSAIVTSTVGTCSVTDYAQNAGYVYPGMYLRYIILFVMYSMLSCSRCKLTDRVCLLFCSWCL